MSYMKVNRNYDPGQESPVRPPSPSVTYGNGALMTSVQEVEKTMSNLLHAEEALLEALCFDFVTSSPHAEIAAIAERHDEPAVHENAWALAHDS
jgi:hypothetical protein